MIEQRFDTVGGLSAPIQVYDNLGEAEAIVPGGLLKQANNNMVYRQVLPLVREIICNLVEEKTGVARESKVVGKTKGGKDITQWEADAKYVNRALAEQVAAGKRTDEEGFKDLQNEVDSLCRSYQDEEDKKAGKPASPLAVDIKGAVRTPPEPKKLAAKYKVKAALILTEGTLDNANTRFQAINKSFTPTNDTTKMFAGTFVDDKTTPAKSTPYNVSDKDAEALGWLIKEWAEWNTAQAAASL